MQYNVPNMLFSKTNFEGSSISIRGVGNSAVADSSDQGVGVHINDIYLNEPRIFEVEFFDVARVEVLRGPQGTLYGRNTTAGVVNMITAKPTDDKEGKIKVGVGDYNEVKLEGMFNLPLSNNVATRLAVYSLNRDGYTDNVYTGNDIDDRDLWSVRSTTSFLFGDRTEATLMLSYYEEDDSRSRVSRQLCTPDSRGAFGHGCEPGSKGFGSANDQATIGTVLSDLLTANAAFSQATGGPDRPFYSTNTGLDSGAKLTWDFAARDILTGSLLDAGLPIEVIDGAFDAYTDLGFSGLAQNSYADSYSPTDMRKVNADFDPEFYADETIASFELVHDFDSVTVKSITAIHEGEIEALTDYDWAVPSVNYLTPVPWEAHGKSRVANFMQGIDMAQAETEQWSQQITLLSNGDGDFSWTGGAYFMHFEKDSHYTIWHSSLTAYADAGGLGSIVEAVFGVPADPLPRGQALFDSYGKYEVDTWAIFGEGYYDFSDNTRLTVGVRYSDETKENQTRLYYVDLAAGYNDPLSYQENDWQEVTGKIGIDHNIDLSFTDSTMLYATIARGYKGGGFNPPATTPGLYPDTFDPEYINTIELGAKSSLLDNTVQANLTAFYYDYEGLQVSQIVNQTAVNENTDAEIMGFEAEFMFAPSANWLFAANLAFLDAEIGDFSTVDTTDPTQGEPFLKVFGNVIGLTGPDVVLDLEGNSLVNSPDFSINVFAEYFQMLSNGMSVTYHIDYYMQDDYYARNFNTKADEVDSWDVSNAAVTLSSADDSWSVRAWVKNIQDDDNMTGHYTTDSTSGFFTNVFVLEPRTYGVSFAMNF